MQSQDLNANGITLTITYTPDEISNCFFGGSIAPTFPPLLGQEQGETITGTAILTTVLSITCNPPTGSAPALPIAFQPYTKQVTVTTAGSSLALPESTWNTVAAEMLAYLALYSFVIFTSPITVSG